MSLKPSLRIRRRHILFYVVSEKSIKKNEIIREILNSCLRFLGELKAGELYLWISEYDENTKTGILSCSRESLSDVISAITLINKINGKKAAVITLKVSGTIKTLKRKKQNIY